MIWLIGDSEIEDAVKEFAGEEEFFSSAIPGASPEDVWTRQKHFGRRRWTEPVTVVCWINDQDYDSEATVWHILGAIPQGSKVIYFYPNSSVVKEGLEHYKLDSLVTCQIDNIDEVPSALKELQ